VCVVIEDFIKAYNQAFRVNTLGLSSSGAVLTKIQYCRFDGETAQNKRQKMVNDFNRNPKDDVMLISTKAGGLGLNIPSASRVVLVDCGWNPGMSAYV
jgi:SNF2 family DNA or RNA helicase